MSVLYPALLVFASLQNRDKLSKKRGLLFQRVRSAFENTVKMIAPYVQTQSTDGNHKGGEGDWLLRPAHRNMKRGQKNGFF